jgi:DNA end-binding protein Ku
MAPRAISSVTISFGLVSIPVKVYTAASSQSVRFNMLHEKCGGRIKQQLYCPVDDEVIQRSDTVKGYEYTKGQYVQFTPEELKSLEAEKSSTLDIVEFVPEDSVDMIQVDKSYYLGPDKGGQKAYKLISGAMERTGKIAVGRWMTRGKSQLVLIRPYKEGLLLHQVYYADEVRSFEDIDIGDEVSFKPGEPDLADQLIEQLAADTFEPEKYEDEYRKRVLAAVEAKVAGQEITAAPEQPVAQIVDLFDALKASLGPAKAGGKKGTTKVAASKKKKKSTKKGPKKATPKKSASKKKKAAG